jgi:hypothetical protein
MTKPLRVLAAFAACFISACGSGASATSPSAPSAATTPTTSTPAAPTPAPNSSLPVSCRALPPATGTAAGCHQEASDFVRAVTDAVSAAQNATVVDPDSKETYALVQDGLIQSPNTYVKMIIDSLDKQGLCAAYDGEEINVRKTNGFNEQFDVITSRGESWIKYMSTCTPATPIPVIPAPPVQDPECRLPPSRESYCDRPSSVYGGDVFSAMDELIAQDRQLAQPLIFDFGDHAPGVDNGWRVTNVPLYFSELRKKLRTRGYCSVYSGDDELYLKKGTNRFSEHWDLLKSEGYSLRLMAAVCHDAAF